MPERYSYAIERTATGMILRRFATRWQADEWVAPAPDYRERVRQRDRAWRALRIRMERGEWIDDRMTL